MTMPTTREGWIAYFADTLPSERVSKAIDCLLSVQSPLAELVACKDMDAELNAEIMEVPFDDDDSPRRVSLQLRTKICYHAIRQDHAWAAARAALNAKEAP